MISAAVASQQAHRATCDAYLIAADLSVRAT